MLDHPAAHHRVEGGVGVGQLRQVGDSVRQDVEGGLKAGMRAVLLRRSGEMPDRARELGVPIITSLRELPELL